MATCDPDGKIAQALGDQMQCLGMSLNESLSEAQRKFEADFPELKRD